MTISNRPRPWRWIALIAALVFLNASLTFRNVWPTPGITWSSDLSIELAAGVLLLALATWRFGAPPRPLISLTAVAWLLLTISRYADVTAPAIYGREVNLYWDSRHVGAVISMMVSVVPTWMLVAGSAALAAAIYAAYRLFRWALGAVGNVMRGTRERQVLAAVALVVCALFVTNGEPADTPYRQREAAASPYVPTFSAPVTASYARQVRLFATGLSGTTNLPPAKRIEADLSGVAGADVFVVFVESYGAVSFDNPAFAEGLAPARERLAADVADTNRQAVSAFVTSPTFGGSSWLAHVSLLTGVEVRNEDTNVKLMAQSRDTMVTVFARRGYRTIATMPGNYHPWPEGGFYGFDDIYNRDRLDYRGPRFGWWPVPDQFTLARFDQLELSRPWAPGGRKPVFVLMPTISTHAPFGPIAPYQPDWDRLLGAQPYAEEEVKLALAKTPDLLNMGPSYVSSIAYTLTSIGGYLRKRADRDFVLIVLGDHQPAAAVSGEGASWDVPVHVIASRPAVLARLEAHGFTKGLTPARTSLGPMNTMLPVLLDSFGAKAPPGGMHAE